jgi:hypothetical protein
LLVILTFLADAFPHSDLWVGPDAALFAKSDDYPWIPHAQVESAPAGASTYVAAALRQGLGSDDAAPVLLAASRRQQVPMYGDDGLITHMIVQHNLDYRRRTLAALLWRTEAAK